MKEKMSMVSLPLLLLFLSLTVGSGFLLAQRANVMDYNTLEKFRFARRLFYKGEHHYNKGKIKKAEKTFQECLKKFPTYSFADFYLGRIYYDAGDYPKALAHIEKAKTNHKSFSSLAAATYQEYIDRLREQKRSLEQEVREMKQQLVNYRPPAATNSSNTGSNNNNSSGGESITRADMLNQQTGQAMTAKENKIQLINSKLLEPVAKVAETPAEYHYIHANILFKLKRFKDSFDQYHLTVKHDPKHGNAYSNLANLNFMVKRYKTALDYLDKAEKYGAEPNPKFRAALIKAIKKK
ncbi:MAG: tetratricopeptide repeat protein [bacterium]|nr:tetratricopeptide repeat protein [bacterium]